ncbi:unnamed protein product, partial [Owenia fusiformis]
MPVLATDMLQMDESVMVRLLIKYGILMKVISKIGMSPPSLADRPSSAYIIWSDLPYSIQPQILEQIWPSSQSDVLEVSYHYKFPMKMPLGFLQHFIEKCQKLTPILALWQEGLFCRYGAVDILCSTRSEKDGDLLSLSTRLYNTSSSE